MEFISKSLKTSTKYLTCENFVFGKMDSVESHTYNWITQDIPSLLGINDVYR